MAKHGRAQSVCWLHTALFFIMFGLLFWIVTPQFAYAQETPAQKFSAAVKQLTQDWEAEDWKEGVLQMHPDQFTWQSDYYLNITRDEPIADRSFASIIKAKFDDPEYSPPKEISADLWVSVGEQRPYNHVQMTISGVMKTRANRYLNFFGQCERNEKQYSFDLCMKNIVLLLEAFKAGVLVVPDNSAPLMVSGWKDRYGLDGVSTLVRSNYNNTVNAVVRVSPPMQIPQDGLPEVIRAYADQAIDDNDQAEKNPGTIRWVGSTADPWIRRDFPDAFDGPSVIMAGTTRTPDGRTVLLSVRVPNASWQPSAARALEKAKLFITTGEVEAKRQQIILASYRPLPADGIKPAQIEGVYSVGTQDGLTYSTTGYLFLKDGTVLKNLDDPPAMISLSESRKNDPAAWGTWRRAGSNIAIKWGDGETTSINASPQQQLVGGTKTIRLEGYYGTISSGGNLITGSGYVSRLGYRFHADGSFEKSSSSSFSVGGFIAGEAGPVPIAGGSGSSNSGGARYEIDGYMITITYGDGRIDRLFFARYAKDAANNRPGSIMLDGSLYNLNGGED